MEVARVGWCNGSAMSLNIQEPEFFANLLFAIWLPQLQALHVHASILHGQRRPEAKDLIFRCSAFLEVRRALNSPLSSHCSEWYHTKTLHSFWGRMIVGLAIIPFLVLGETHLPWGLGISACYLSSLSEFHGQGREGSAACGMCWCPASKSWGKQYETG